MMYNKSADFIIGYIQHILDDSDYPVYDVNFEFEEPNDYASFYIFRFIPSSPFSNEISTSSDEELINKTTNYLNNGTVQIKIDFRGENCFENMATFERSFFKQINKDFLKDAGFGFMGFTLNPDVISNLQTASIKQGITATVKFSSSEVISDTNTIVKNFNVSTQIVKEL